MKLAMEIPYHHLEELSKLCDFDFALGQVVLDQGPKSKYVKFYKKQSEKGRQVWLDNGWHELRKCLPDNQLLEAAKLIGATHIVAPETRNNAHFTLYQIFSLWNRIKEAGYSYKVVGCWQGHRKEMFRLLDHCDEVALPFDRPRRVYLKNKEESGLFHYFGFRSLDELRILPPKSLDTSMPIRAALYGIDLQDRERRPKTPLLDFTIKLTKEQVSQTIRNIFLVRGIEPYG